jgi:transcriptional regulator with XRE-family HTH domain
MMNVTENSGRMAAHAQRSQGVGWAIRRVRKDRKRTLEDVADAVGWDAGNLSRVERGVQDIPESRLRGIAHELGIGMTDLYGLAESADEEAMRLMAAARALTDADREQLREYADFLLARQRR